MSEQQSFADLSGRVALVTGAGQGVGRAIARLMAAQNAKAVIVNDFFAERAEAVAEEIRQDGGQAIGIAADVSDLSSVQAMVKQARDEVGPIDILVNNAGNAGPSGFPSNLPTFWETDPEEWPRFFGVNLYGVMNCCHAVMGSMAEREYGRVLTIISDASREGEPKLATYCAAKAGAGGLMRSLAKEGGKFNITANCISLSAINNPQLQAQADSFPPDMMKKMLKSYSIRRLGEPEDVAGLAVLLCSDSAAWITGQTYPVNGGHSSAL